VGAGAGGDEHTAVMERDEFTLDGDPHGLAGEPAGDVIVHGSEADDAMRVDAPRRHQPLDMLGLRLGSWRRLHRFTLGDGSELEATDRSNHPDALVGSLMVVALDPRIDSGLRSREIGEHLAGDAFALERLVEPFDLPRRGR
jgi:hypothetical protein